MEVVSQGAVIPALDSDVFTNASTIASWLEKEPENVRARLANVIFNELVAEAVKPRQSPARPCMKLCGLVQLCAKSSDEGLRQWAFSRETSMALFNYYIEWKQPLQLSSMKLVLDALTTTATQNPNPETGALVKTAVLDFVVTVISRQAKRSPVKASMYALVHFLAKHAVGLDDVKSTYQKVKPPVSGLSDLQLWRSFVADIFSWMKLREVCQISGKLLLQLLHGLRGRASGPPEEQVNPDFAVETWLEWIQVGVAGNPETLETVKSHVFAPLFKTDKKLSLKLLGSFNRQKLGHGMGDELGSLALLQLAALEVGRKAGLVAELGTSSSTATRSNADMIVVEQHVLENFLTHPARSIRCSALGLLVSSPFTTKPISPETLDLLRRHLATYFADDDVKLRHDTLSYCRVLMSRVKNVISVTKTGVFGPAAKRQGSSSADIVSTPAKGEPDTEGPPSSEKEQMETLRRHESFLRWYFSFIQGELIPTASYQRHITALRSLHYTFKVVKDATGSKEITDENMIAMVFPDPTWVRLMLDLVMDPFDHVRETAVAILQMIPQDIIAQHVGDGASSPTLLSTLREFCTRAMSLADRTSRADHSNGAARAQGLLCSWQSTQDARVTLILEALDRLEAKLARADRDLGHAAIQDSVHLDFAALGYIWQVLAAYDDYSESDRQALQQVQRRMFKNCEHVWNLVEHVLCDDSPEGHLPEELEDIEGLDTRSLLSYSFRAIHESSKLMQIIVENLRNCSKPAALLPPLDVFSGIGSLTFTQLSTLRHRGAFATVSSTFISCCQLTLKLTEAFPDGPKIEDYLQRWYEGALKCIMNQASTTRRSAGIPALIIGILSTNSKSLSFKEVLPTLVSIAERTARIAETDGSNLPQVHALNCLKEVFKTSGLNTRAELYVPTMLQLAASSLRSEVWAIRNCGLILLRSLIDCLVGTCESKSSVEAGWDGHTMRLSYSKYPSLPGVLLSLLKTGEESLELSSQSGKAEAVFPALDIIRRAGPPEQHREELYGYVEEYLGSHLWHVREIAARALCSFLLRDGWVAALREVLSRSRDGANRLHGALLAVKFVLVRKLDAGDDATREDIPELLSALDELLVDCKVLQATPDALAALVEISNLARPHARDALASIPSNSPPPSGSSRTFSALLRVQLGINAVYDSARHTDVTSLRQSLKQELEVDVDTACRMLEAIPETWGRYESPEVASQLCGLYLDVHQHTSHPEPRELALLNLRGLIDKLLRAGRFDLLPSEQGLRQLWTKAQAGEMNPALAQAALEISGVIMATNVLRGPPGPSALGPQLQAWGNMMADALEVENGLDTRFAAVEALKSFFSAVGPPTSEPYIPCLLALYDALNDDNDEIRSDAAVAAAPVIGKRVVPLEAADLLVDWLVQHLGYSEVFRSAVVQRLVGQQQTSTASVDQTWIPAETLLKEAMEFDESLFVVEKRNLFIDEIRESKRWARVSRALVYTPKEEPYWSLQDWTTAGLRSLNELALKDDGPLGWTSQDQAFAVCGRVLLCAATHHDTSGRTQLRELLQEFAIVGKKSRIHGSLLCFADSNDG